MANQLSITVSRRLQKVTPSCAIVKLSMKQRYEFENLKYTFFVVGTELVEPHK